MFVCVCKRGVFSGRELELRERSLWFVFVCHPLRFKLYLTSILLEDSYPREIIQKKRRRRRGSSPHSLLLDRGVELQRRQLPSRLAIVLSDVVFGRFSVGE